MSSPPPGRPGDVPGHIDGADELHVEARPRRTAVVVVVLLVAVLAGWWVLRDPAAPAGAGPIAAGTGDAVTPEAPATVGSPPPPDPDAQTIDQLTFLDDRRGVALRLDCGTVNAEGFCPRSLLVTDDGGATWTVTGALPAWSDGFAQFLVDPAGPVAVLDAVTMRTLGRSLDLGRTWEQVPLRPGAPRPAGAGTTLLTDTGTSCGDGCGDLVWIDLADVTVHRLPTPPPARQGDWVPAVGRSSGVLSVADDAGAVAVSTDGGLSWRVTAFPVVLAPEQRPGGTVLRAGGGDRLYAFVQIDGAVGLETAYGYRSDDAGTTWVDIGFAGRTVWIPAGVVDGELITTNLPGGVFLSSGDGTAFTTVPDTPVAMFLSQGDPGGAVLGTVFDQQGRSSYWLSRDGRDWSPLLLPTA